MWAGSGRDAQGRRRLSPGHGALSLAHCAQRLPRAAMTIVGYLARHKLHAPSHKAPVVEAHLCRPGADPRYPLAATKEGGVEAVGQEAVFLLLCVLCLEVGIIDSIEQARAIDAYGALQTHIVGVGNLIALVHHIDGVLGDGDGGVNKLVSLAIVKFIAPFVGSH